MWENILLSRGLLKMAFGGLTGLEIRRLLVREATQLSKSGMSLFSVLYSLPFFFASSKYVRFGSTIPIREADLSSL